MARITSMLIRFLSFILSTTLGSAQIRVLSPRSLVDQFKSQKGRIKGSTAMFGAPFYGDTIMGRLVYADSVHNHCNASEYSLKELDTVHGAAPSHAHDQVRLINIVLVRRGSCSFVTKVRIASKKGAHAVVIVDRDNSPLTSDDLQNIIVADDGYGKTISIPSVLISHMEGDKLIEAVKKGPEVVVELAWNIPVDRTVTLDLWMSSGSAESMQFLKAFAESRKALNEVVKFVPHYHVFSATPETGGYNGLCTDASARFCAPDPDASGDLTGKDVLEEDVRQLCLHEKYKVARFHGEKNAQSVVFYSKEWWDYVEQFADKCPIDGKDPLSRFGEQCSYALMNEIGVDTAKIQNCVKSTQDKKLENERVNKAWSPRALRVNGWRYKGILDAELVTRAVCSGFVTKPQECEELLKPRDPTVKYLKRDDEGGVSMGTLVAVLGGMFVLVVCIMFLYRKFLNTSLHARIREEVMLEVSNKMDEYRKLPPA